MKKILILIAYPIIFAILGLLVFSYVGLIFGFLLGLIIDFFWFEISKSIIHGETLYDEY